MNEVRKIWGPLRILTGKDRLTTCQWDKLQTVGLNVTLHFRCPPAPQGHSHQSVLRVPQCTSISADVSIAQCYKVQYQPFQLKTHRHQAKAVSRKVFVTISRTKDRFSEQQGTFNSVCCVIQGSLPQFFFFFLNYFKLAFPLMHLGCMCFLIWSSLRLFDTGTKTQLNCENPGTISQMMLHLFQG